MNMMIQEELELKGERRNQVYCIDQDTGQQYEISVYYSKGGMNWVTSTHRHRGYYLSTTPVAVGVRENGARWQQFVAFEGVYHFIEETARFSKKRFGELVYEYSRLENPQVERMLRHVKEKRDNAHKGESKVRM